MVQTEIEHWVCKENIARFQIGLQGQVDDAKRSQLMDLLSRELFKLQEFFPNQ